MDLLKNTEIINNLPIKTSDQIISSIIDQFQNNERELPINTGYKSLSRVFNGFKKNQITIIGARSSMGKTCMALNLILNLIDNDKRVLMFDLEEQEEQNYHRILSNITNYPLRDKLDDPDLNQAGKETILKLLEYGKKRLKSKNLYYVSRPNLTLDSMREIALNLKDIDLIVIDHLTKVKSPIKGNIYERVTDVTSNLRQLSYELGGIPLIVLAQINRGAEDRKNKKPLLSDLKGSGEIEENADVVILLYTEGYYKEEMPDEEPIHLNVAKNRHGRTGTVKLLFNRPLQKITEINHIT